MKFLENARLVDALADFAEHERVGRNGAEAHPPFVTPLDAVEYALWKRATILAHLLIAKPFATVRAQFDRDDEPSLRYAITGQTPEDWYVSSAMSARPEQAAWVRKLAESGDRIGGPLLFAARADIKALPEVICSPPIVVFDGYHRVAAWIMSGCRYPIEAYLVMTEQPLFAEATAR